MDAKPIKPLIVIVGPTASGKTSLAIDLAEEVGGEIICADSRTIYKDMDIGTAKPSPEERQCVPHWGLDLVQPGDRFTASDFKEYANEKIADIRIRGKVPFLVGGTGLYIDSVVFNYQFGGEPDTLKRRYLEGLNIAELHEYCYKNNIVLPENDKNKRYIIRVIERKDSIPQKASSPLGNCIIVGIATDKAILRQRIADRSEQLLSQPVVNEAKILGEKYGWESEAMSGNIYPLVRSYLENKIELSEIKNAFEELDWKLAKRQLTWFRRNPHIMWLLKDEMRDYIHQLLAGRR